jgi:hypothetical protein
MRALLFFAMAACKHDPEPVDTDVVDTEVVDTEVVDTDVVDTDLTPPAMVDPCAFAGPGERDASSDALADPSRYAAPFELVVDDDGSLSWSNASGDPNYASVRNVDWAVVPGQTYILRATFVLSPSTRAFLAVNAYAAGTPKDDFGDPLTATWWTTPSGVSRMRDGATDDPNPQEVCLAFTPNAGETLAGVRIGGFGADEVGQPSGPVTLTDVHVDRMGPIGTFVRFAVAGAASPLTAHLVFRYPAYPDTNPDFPGILPADGSFGPWVDATRFSPGGDQSSTGFGSTAYYGLSFLDDSGEVTTDGALSVEITTDPDVPPYYASPVTPLADVQLLYLPDETSNLGSRPAMVGLMADVYEYQLDDFEARHPSGSYVAPTRYFTSSDLAPAGTIDRPEIVDTAMALFHDAGFNGVWSTGADIEARSVAAGITNHAASFDAGQLNAYYYGTADFDRDAMYADATSIFESYHYADELAPWAAEPDHVLLFLFDELYGPTLFGGPELQQAFCDYLVDQGQGDLVAGGCDTVAPILAPPAFNPQFGAPEDPEADPDAARLWYWSVRFHNWAAAELLEQSGAAMRDVTGVDYPITINCGQPSTGTCGFAAGVETRELLRPHGADQHPVIDVLWGEEFSLGRCGAEYDSVEADYWAAEVGTTATFGAYTHAGDGFLGHKVLSSAVRGGRYYDPWTFPMNLGQYNQALSEQWMDQSAASNDLLAKVEPLLYDGERVGAGVGILVGQTDPMWNYANNAEDCPGCTVSNSDMGTHYLLTHAHYPVDFVIEEDLGAMVDGVCRPGAGLDGVSVLFLNRRYLSSCAFDALKTWVEAGGTLIAGKELPVYDQYAQPVPARQDWFAVGVTPVHPTVAGTIAWGARTLTEPVGFDVVGLTLPSGDPDVTEVARYASGTADGLVAAADVARGSGTVRIVGFSAGTWYFQPVWACTYPTFYPSLLTPSLDQRPAGFDDDLRDALTELLVARGVDRPVVPSDPRVAGQLVLDTTGSSVTGGAIVLQDYRNDAPTPITVDVPSLSGCVTSALTGDTYTITGHTLSLAVGDVEVLGFSTTGDCAATYAP